MLGPDDLNDYYAMMEGLSEKSGSERAARVAASEKPSSPLSSLLSASGAVVRASFMPWNPWRRA